MPPQRRLGEETIHKSTGPVSEERWACSFEEEKELETYRASILSVPVDVASSQVRKLRDRGPGCLFSIRIVMAFP